MTESARAALPFSLDEESDVLATATHVLGDVDLLVACIDGVENARRESGLGSLVGGEQSFEAPHGGRVGHVSLPAKSVGVPAAPELHVPSLTSVTRNAKIMGDTVTEPCTACQQTQGSAAPTLSQESWCPPMLDAAIAAAYKRGHDVTVWGR